VRHSRDQKPGALGLAEDTESTEEKQINHGYTRMNPTTILFHKSVFIRENPRLK